MDQPTVLFVCVHNAGRSQMAAALLEKMSGGRVRVLSAGSEPADRLHPEVIEVMKQEGIDLTSRKPRILDAAEVKESDVVITMGCGDVCPVFPGKRYEDWELEDPKGKTLEEVKAIRDEIRRRVAELLDSIS